MANEEDEEYSEKKENVTCDSCVIEVWANHAENICSKFDAEGEHGLIQDAICDSCFETEFIDEPNYCIDSCYNEKVIVKNIKRSFGKVFKNEGLELSEFKGVEGYMGQHNFLFI